MSHRRSNRIQTHALVANDACLGDQTLHQHPSESEPAIAGPHVKTFHFANASFNPAQRNAAAGVVATLSQQQSSGWRSVSTGKIFQLFVKTLETQAEVERASIFEEKGTDLFDVFGQSGLKQFDLGAMAVGAMALNTLSVKKIAVVVGRHGNWRPFTHILMVAEIPFCTDAIATRATDG